MITTRIFCDGGPGRTDTNIDITRLFPKCDNSGSIKPQKEFPAAVSPIDSSNERQKEKPVVLWGADRPMTELWCEGSARRFGKRGRRRSTQGSRQCRNESASSDEPISYAESGHSVRPGGGSARAQARQSSSRRIFCRTAPSMPPLSQQTASACGEPA